LIKEIARGLSVILVEHKMKVVMDLSDKITVLHEGEVIARGNPQEIRRMRPYEGCTSEGKGMMLEVQNIHTYYGRATFYRACHSEWIKGNCSSVGRNGAGKLRPSGPSSGWCLQIRRNHFLREKITGIPVHHVSQKGSVWCRKGVRSSGIDRL